MGPKPHFRRRKRRPYWWGRLERPIVSPPTGSASLVLVPEQKAVVVSSKKQVGFATLQLLSAQSTRVEYRGTRGLHYSEEWRGEMERMYEILTMDCTLFLLRYRMSSGLVLQETQCASLEEVGIQLNRSVGYGASIRAPLDVQTCLGTYRQMIETITQWVPVFDLCLLIGQYRAVEPIEHVITVQRQYMCGGN